MIQWPTVYWIRVQIDAALEEKQRQILIPQAQRLVKVVE